MKILTSISIFIAAVLLISCGEAKDPVTHDYDKREMDQAIARAKSEVDLFINSLSKANGDYYGIKYGFPMKNGDVEYCWVGRVSFSEGVFIGKLDNVPQGFSNLKVGDLIKVKKDEIGDWLIKSNSKLYGAYTIRVLDKSGKNSGGLNFAESGAIP